MELPSSNVIKLGFHNQWVDNVMKCVTFVSYSVLFNWEPLDSFQPTRGLRQGDPISPYLFFICVEALTCAIKHEEADGNL